VRNRSPEPNLVLASKDRAAPDMEGMKVTKSYPGNSLSKNPWDYTQIRTAADLGVGATSEAEHRLVTEQS